MEPRQKTSLRHVPHALYKAQQLLKILYRTYNIQIIISLNKNIYIQYSTELITNDGVME